MPSSSTGVATTSAALISIFPMGSPLAATVMTTLDLSMSRIRQVRFPHTATPALLVVFKSRLEKSPAWRLSKTVPWMEGMSKALISSTSICASSSRLALCASSSLSAISERACLSCLFRNGDSSMQIWSFPAIFPSFTRRLRNTSTKPCDVRGMESISCAVSVTLPTVLPPLLTQKDSVEGALSISTAHFRSSHSAWLPELDLAGVSLRHSSLSACTLIVRAPMNRFAATSRHVSRTMFTFRGSCRGWEDRSTMSAWGASTGPLRMTELLTEKFIAPFSLLS
mmetsp:Transcript_19867/g.44366  ORF Transcript_19867/g.44366 Transcript_19867/m.44366 type:complete len:282 (-) Transcript_19867:2509-3354(-)